MGLQSQKIVLMPILRVSAQLMLQDAIPSVFISIDKQLSSLPVRRDKLKTGQILTEYTKLIYGLS